MVKLHPSRLKFDESNVMKKFSRPLCDADDIMRDRAHWALCARSLKSRAQAHEIPGLALTGGRGADRRTMG
jgi:hypothetical protein